MQWQTTRLQGELWRDAMLSVGLGTLWPCSFPIWQRDGQRGRSLLPTPSPEGGLISCFPISEELLGSQTLGREPPAPGRPGLLPLLS